jgi:hypothetical protein
MRTFLGIVSIVALVVFGVLLYTTPNRVWLDIKAEPAAEKTGLICGASGSCSFVPDIFVGVRCDNHGRITFVAYDITVLNSSERLVIYAGYTKYKEIHHFANRSHTREIRVKFINYDIFNLVRDGTIFVSHARQGAESSSVTISLSDDEHSQQCRKHALDTLGVLQHSPV